MKLFSRASVALVLGMAFAASVFADGFPDKATAYQGPNVVTLPGVPPSVVAAGSNGPSPKNRAPDSPVSADGHVVITATPGVTEVIPIAKTHLNKIVLPFDDPRIVTSVGKDVATQWTEGRIVYVATNQEAPFSFFVPLPDDPTRTLSLALAPTDRSTPVDIEIRVKGFENATGTESKAAVGSARKPHFDDAARWETGGDYEETLTRLIRGLALGQVPDGYGLIDVDAGRISMPRCDLPHIDIEPRQQLDGARLIVFVARALNSGDAAAEIDESRCAGPDVAAVAAWPLARLEPGERTELYIVVRRGTDAPQGAQRPSVLGGR